MSGLNVKEQIRGSIRPDSEELQNSLEVGIAKESDFESALALGVAEADFGSEALAQAIFQMGDMSIGGCGSGRPGL